MGGGLVSGERLNYFMFGTNFLKIIIGLVIILVTSPFFMFGQSKQTANAALEIKADTLLDQQDFEGALKLYSDIIKKTKRNNEYEPSVLYKRAYCFYTLKRFDEALVDLNQYLEKVPNDQAKILRLYVYQELENTEAQLSDLNELISKTPENVELLRWRLSLEMESEKYKGAQYDIIKLLSIQDDPTLKGYLGLTYYYLENLDSALIVFDDLIKQYPDNIQTYLYAGSVCLEEEAYDASLHYINQGLKIEPTNGTLLYYKGAALVEKEDIDDGCRCLNKAFANGIDDAGEYLKEYCYGGN